MAEHEDDLLPELARQLDYAQALAYVAKALTAETKQSEVLGTIMRHVSQLLNPSNWSLLLLDEDAGALRFEVVVGEASESLEGQSIPADQGVAGWVLKHRQGLVVPDVAKDARFSGHVDTMSKFKTGSICAVPLVCRDALLGVIELVNGRNEEPFTDEHLQLMGPFADFAAIAISNARAFERIREITLVDEWTQLYNARYLQTCILDEVRRAVRYKRPLSVVFFDLDHFKRVNDEHSHAVGSALLRHVGELIKASTRRTDRCIRYGGDEFIIIMPETEHDKAMVIAQRLRESLATTVFEEAGAKLTLTASFGVASYPDHADDSDMLLKKADLAMYEAKKQGRNRVATAFEHP